MEVTDTKMDKKITANDIYKTRRIGKPKNNGKPRPLIINFVRYNDRKKVFSSKKLVKDSVVSITESLTAFRMKNLTDARQTVGISNVWTRREDILLSEWLPTS